MGKCQKCGGMLLVLGVLGQRLHLRCQNCGSEFSRELTPEDREELELDGEEEGA